MALPVIARSGTNAAGQPVATLVDVETAINSIGFNYASQFNAGFLAWFGTLPTSPPSVTGVPWNNGGVLCVS